MDSAVNTPSTPPADPTSSAPPEATTPATVQLTGLNKVTGGLLLLGGAPLVVVFFMNLWAKEYYQFFPLALAGAGFLAWLRWQEMPKPLETGTGWVTGGLMLGSWLLMAAATAFWSPWAGMVAALIGLLGAIWWLGGWPLLRAMLPACFMLLTVLPPPLNLDVRFTMKLRSLATQWSGSVLDALSVTHAVSGNVIEIPNQRLLVEEACSGINSILSTTAVCLFYCLWRRRSILHILVMLAMTVGFVLLGNVARIVSGAWFRFSWDINIMSGWKHETIGLVLFAGYLGLILSADALLEFLFSPSGTETTKPAAPDAPSAPVAMVWTASKTAWVAGLAFGLLGLAQLGQGGMRYVRHETESLVSTTALVQRGATFTMPAQIGNWRRLDSERPTSIKVESKEVQSQSWHYQNSDLVATLALDYPFRGYHDVTICYTGSGWEIVRNVTRPAAASPDGAPFVEAKMQKDLVAKAALLFSTLDERGQWVDGSYIKRNTMERFRGESSDTTYRVQMIVPHYVPLSTAKEEQVLALFLEARKLLREQVMSQMPKK